MVRSDWQDTVERIRETAQSFGATFVQSHAPGGPVLACTDDFFNATVRSIEVCGALGIPNIVVHAGTYSKMDKAEFFDKNRAFFRRLIPVMEKTGVNVLCENSTKANTGTGYFTNSGADMKEFVEFLDHPLFHACWDTGHANVEGNQYEEILALGSDLYALHINDNRGSQDEHLLPFLGTMNLDEILHALIDGNYKGYFTFEAASNLRPKECWLGNRREFAKDDRLAEAPLFLQQHLEKAMYELGVYILKKYDVYEE
jgi:sugar phosphate isomerase/epimerase